MKNVLFFLVFIITVLGKEKDWSPWIKKIENKNDWKRALKNSQSVIGKCIKYAFL